MAVRTEPSERWVRAYVEDALVVDSREPWLVWEDRLPVPRYAYPKRDVRMDLLAPTTEKPPSQPFFFLPQEPVAEWYDIVVGERRVPFAAWVLADPAIEDRIVVSWQPGLIDRWLEEDEEVWGHPRDPHKRVDALPSSRRVVATLDGTVLADTEHPVLLFETGLPTRYYFPISDVALDLLTPTDNRSHCPYKGFATRYWTVAGREDLPNLAWSYSEPYPAVDPIKDMIAFYNELVDITIDGELQPRATSPFAQRAYRPGA